MVHLESSNCTINCDRIWKNPASTHTISNLCSSHEGLANVCYLQFGVLWAQERSSRAPNWTSGFQLSSYSILYSYICVSLEWHFGTIGWSWLSCIGAWRAGQATKGWPMSVIFNLECCEHKKGPVGPQTGPLAFNCLRIPFCTPTLSLYSYVKHTLHPDPPTTPITTTCNIITITKKAA